MIYKEQFQQSEVVLFKLLKITSPIPTVSYASAVAAAVPMPRGRTVWDNPTAILPSSFMPIAGEECISCGTCVDRCFFGALSLSEEEGKAVVDPDKCIGCGVCTMTCPEETLKLHRYERPEAPFNNNAEFFMTIASDNERI